MSTRPCKLCKAMIQFHADEQGKQVAVQRVHDVYYLDGTEAKGRDKAPWLRKAIGGSAPKYVAHADVCPKYKRVE